MPTSSWSGTRVPPPLSQTDETVVEFSNECICCTLRDSLQEVRCLAEEKRCDYLLIESTGIRKPMPVSATFSVMDADGFSLSYISRLNTMVTVVDGRNFLKEFGPAECLADRNLQSEPKGMPLVLHGAQDVISAETWLDDWPQGRRESGMVLITEKLAPPVIQMGLDAFIPQALVPTRSRAEKSL